MNKVKILTKNSPTVKRINLLISCEHKRYIEDVAHKTRTAEQDVFFQIIEHYKQSHPLETMQ